MSDGLKEALQQGFRTRLSDLAEAAVEPPLPAAAAPAVAEPLGSAAAVVVNGHPAVDAGRLRVLQGMLTKTLSSPAQCQQIVDLLRKWSAEGRSFRGHSFTPAEVEHAIETVLPKYCKDLPRTRSRSRGRSATVGETAAAAAADAAELPPETPDEPPRTRSVEIKAEHDWPPQELWFAAMEVVRSLGTLPVKDMSAEVAVDVLRGLHRIRREHQGSMQIQCDSRVVQVHAAIFCALSPVLRARFDNSFADSTDSLQARVSAAQFEELVVHRAVEFMYLGRCRAELCLLTSLWSFADFFGIAVLCKAVEQSWTNLPIVKHLQVLSGASYDPSSPVPFLQPLSHSIASGFERAACILQGGGPEGPFIWRLVKDLHDFLKEVPPASMQRLRRWFSELQRLGDALEQFHMAALPAVSADDDVKHLCAAHMKGWLPPDRIVSIVSKLCTSKGFIKEEEELYKWLGWTFTGLADFDTLWNVYRTLQAHDPPADIESGFAMALAHAAHCSVAGARQWEEVRNDGLAAQESWNHVARLLCHNKVLPAGMSARGAIDLLARGLAPCKPLAVAVQGCSKVAGVYAAATVAGPWVRRVGLCPALALKRVARRAEFGIVWQGMTLAKLRQSPVEWKILGIDEDEEIDTPLALAATDAAGPCQTSGQWWRRGEDGNFVLDEDIAILTEAIGEAAAAPFAEALAAWAATVLGGDAATALRFFDKAVRADRAPPVLLQISMLARTRAGMPFDDVGPLGTVPAAEGAAAAMPDTPMGDAAAPCSVEGVAAQAAIAPASGPPPVPPWRRGPSAPVPAPSAVVAGMAPASAAGPSAEELRRLRLAAMERPPAADAGRGTLHGAGTVLSPPLAAAAARPEAVSHECGARGMDGLGEGIVSRWVRLKNMGPRFDGQFGRLAEKSVLRAGVATTWKVELPDLRSTWVLEDMIEQATPETELQFVASFAQAVAAAVVAALGDLVRAMPGEVKAVVSRKRSLETASSYLAAMDCLQAAAK